MKNKYLMMGWPYGCPPSTQLPYQNDYDMLSIENSIREILINNKCDFTYKLHPDRSDETLELYKHSKRTPFPTIPVEPVIIALIFSLSFITNF